MGKAANLAAIGSIADTPLQFRNRIINGDMRIDQRNAGASVSIGTGAPFIVDRWNAYTDLLNMTGQRSTIVPSGFTNSLGITVGTGASPSAGQISRLEQRIEGFNFSDLGWGAAGAQSVTVSFWVRSSVTGTHSGALSNSAGNRSYPFTFTISAANTWEYKTVTIAGDTTGTWVTDNGVGCKVIFNLGTGSTYLGSAGAWSASALFGATGSVQLSATTGATFYITGVQLEAGTNASPFERRDYGRELAMCQRYLPAWNWVSGNDNVGIGYSFSTTSTIINVAVPVTPRVAPTGASVSAMTNFVLRNGSNVGGTPTAIAFNVTSSGLNQSLVVTTTAGSPTIAAGQGAFLFASGAAQILFTGCEL